MAALLFLFFQVNGWQLRQLLSHHLVKNTQEHHLLKDVGFSNDRALASWNRVHEAIEREKRGILEDIGLSGRPVDIRQFEALERNLAGNRFGWDKTNSPGMNGQIQNIVISMGQN